MTMMLHSLIGAVVCSREEKTTKPTRRRREEREMMILRLSFLNRKPCRRVFVLALVLVVVPLSGRMFYRHKLEFARRISSSRLVIEEQQRGKVHQKMTTTTTTQQQQHREREEEEKRLKLEGNPNVADGGRR